MSITEQHLGHYSVSGDIARVVRPAEGALLRLALHRATGTSVVGVLHAILSRLSTVLR